MQHTRRLAAGLMLLSVASCDHCKSETTIFNLVLGEAPTATIDSPGANLSISLGAEVHFEGSGESIGGAIAGHSWGLR